jgi:hypothetical protein
VRALQRLEVALHEPEHLPAARHPALDEVDEAGARDRGDLDAGRGSECVLVGA